MAEATLRVETELPFAWQPLAAPHTPVLVEGSLLLLRLVNQLDASPQDAEHDRLHERLEAKLDLLLFWLGQALFGQHTPSPRHRLALDAQGVEWVADEDLAVGTAVSLELQLHPRLAGPLRLPARVSARTGHQVRAEFSHGDDAVTEAWTQWLFRCHRRAIQTARENRPA